MRLAAAQAPGGDDLVGPVLAASALEVELPAVPGADQPVSLEEAIAELAAVVRAAILDGVAAPIVGAHHRDLLVAVPGRHDLAGEALPQRVAHRRALMEALTGLWVVTQKVADMGVNRASHSLGTLTIGADEAATNRKILTSCGHFR